jgi:hypothetical protein
MPQIWMTYDELAFLFECEPAAARDIILEMNLDRRKSRDGHTRVKLDASLNALFLDKLFAHWSASSCEPVPAIRARWASS